MAETIRDVVVKIRLQLEKSDEIRKAAEEAVGRTAEKAQVESIKRVATARKQAAQEQTKTVQQQIDEVRKAAEAESKIAVAADRLKDIRMRERLAAFKRNKQEEQRIEAEAEKGPGFFGKGGTYSKASKWVQQTAINVLAAQVVIENAEGFIKGLSEAIQKETAGNVNDEGPVTKFTRGVGTALNNLFETVRKSGGAIGGQAGSTLADQIVKASGLGFLVDRLKGAGLIDGPVTRRVTDPTTGAIDANQKLNAILLDRTKAERDLLDQERKRADAAREEFGLMDARQKEATIQLAKKVGAQGIGGLTPEELDFARGNQAFRGILGEQAKAAADATGFGEITKALGIDKRIADAEAKITAEVKNVIDINIDPANLAKSLEERIAPLLKTVEEKLVQKLKVEVSREMGRMKNTDNVAL